MPISDKNASSAKSQMNQQQGSYQENLNELHQQQRAQQQQQFAQSAQATQQGFGQPNVGRLNPFSGRLFSSPLPRSRGNNIIKDLIEKLGEVYDYAEENINITLIPVDKAGTNLLFGGIIVCAKEASSEVSDVFYHTLILEGTGDPLRPKTYTASTVNGQIEYEVVYTTPQVWDAEYIRVVNELVQSKFPKCNVQRVDATVVPRWFDIEDPDAIWELAANSLAAATNELRIRSDGWKDLNIREFTQGYQYSVNVNFNNNQRIQDIVGNPIKSDIVMEYVLSRKSTQPIPGQYNSLNKGENETKAGLITGYIDLIWSFDEGQIGGGGMLLNNNFINNGNIPPLYTANFVITSLKYDYAATPASILFTLANAMAIENNQLWKQYFKPIDVPKGTIDFHDIGNIGYEFIPHFKKFGGSVDENLIKGGNAYIDFKSDKIGVDVLYQVLGIAIAPQIFVSLDVPDASPDTWALSMFADAADGNKVAEDVIIKAANDLTDGAFSKLYRSSGSMFYNPGNRIHLGYYLDADQNKCDIRDVTYLAALTLSKGELSYVKDFSDTYNKTGYDINLRLSARKKLINEWTGGNAVITGYANRVTFSKEFIYALTAAINQSGYVPRLQTASCPINVGNYRAVPTYLNNVLIDQNMLHTANGGFNYNGGNIVNNQYYMNPPSRYKF